MFSTFAKWKLEGKRRTISYHHNNNSDKMGGMEGRRNGK
jgi:hypothetical protein